jgi:hypothetical protein
MQQWNSRRIDVDAVVLGDAFNVANLFFNSSLQNG